MLKSALSFLGLRRRESPEKAGAQSPQGASPPLVTSQAISYGIRDGLPYAIVPLPLSYGSQPSGPGPMYISPENHGCMHSVLPSTSSLSPMASNSQNVHGYALPQPGFFPPLSTYHGQLPAPEMFAFQRTMPNSTTNMELVRPFQAPLNGIGIIPESHGPNVPPKRLAEHVKDAQALGNLEIMPDPEERPVASSEDENDWPTGYQRREITLPASSNSGRLRHTQSKWVTRSTGYRANAEAGRAERRGCLGVLQCDTCLSLKRPNTQKDSLGAQIAANCSRRRCPNPQLRHIQCQAYTLQWMVKDDTGDTILVWEHYGEHHHPRPPGGPLSNEEQDKLDAQVSLRPDASTHQLRTGTITRGSVPLADITPVLANPRRARTEVAKSRDRLGLQPESHKGGVGFLKSIGTLFDETIREPFLLSSGMVCPAYVTVQTAFMREVLADAVRDWLQAAAIGPDAGRHGCVTDGDHSFFTQGNLITTCMFSSTMNQWVPVLYTWMLHMDTDHYFVHFQQLNAGLILAAGDKFDRRLLSCVTDFSVAQRSGHEKGYVEAIISTLTQWSMLGPKAQEAHREELREEARRFQKGCQTHFHRSGKRIKQNHTLVPLDQQEEFDDLITIFLSGDTSLEEFDEAVNTMRQRFPKVKGWLSWWLAKPIASMIFPAKRSMSTALARELPNTSNPVENRHSQLHHATGVHQDIVTGLRKLFLHVKQLESQFKSIIVVYQSLNPDGHSTASNRIQEARPKTVRFHENDGRAPDTIERLQPTANSKQSRSCGRRGKTSSGVVLASSGTRLESIVSTLPTLAVSRVLPMNDRAKLRRLQSYQWTSNSCFIDVALELWFQAYLLWSPEEQDSIARDLTMQDTGAPLYSIFLHFRHRAGWIASPGCPPVLPGSSIHPLKISRANTGTLSKGKSKALWYMKEDNLSRGLDILSVGQRAVRNGVIEWAETSPGSFRTAPDSFGETRCVLEHAIMDKTTLHAQLQFSIQHHVVIVCPYGHYTSSYTTIPNPILTLFTHDIDRAALACKISKNHLDVGRYLSHLLPRFQATPTKSYNSSNRICDLPTHACSSSECGAATTLHAIRTEWPHLLHLVPETFDKNSAELASMNFSPVHLPFEFNIHSQSLNIDPMNSATSIPDSGVAVSVHYELLGRLIYDQEKAHYTAQVIIDGRSYAYNDMARDGVLMEIGPQEAIVQPITGTTMVLYHRVSDARITEQDAYYIRTTPKLSSPRPLELVIEVTDSDNSSDTPLYKVIQNQTITRKKDIAQFGQPDDSHLRVEIDTKGTRAGSPTSSNAEVVNCSGCDVTEDVGDMIQCSSCLEWSHQNCISIQFGLPSSISDPNASWDCPRCDSSIILWDDQIIGQHILYATIPDGPLYPVMIVWRDGFNAVVEWYYGNCYPRSGGRGNRSQRPQSNLIPIHRCAMAARDHEWVYGKKTRIGQILWPVRLYDDAHDLHGYRNPEVTTALEDAFSTILVILCGEKDHPIIHRFTEHIRGGIPKPEDCMSFVHQFDTLILRGDLSLIHEHLVIMSQLMRRRMQTGKLHANAGSRAWTGDWISALVNGPGNVLFQLVILRLYLERQASDDYEIYRIVIGAIDESIAHKKLNNPTPDSKPNNDSNSSSPGALSNSDLSSNASFVLFDDILDTSDSLTFRPSLRVVRRMTIPEQAYVACLHWRRTDSWDDQGSQPSLEPVQSKIKMDCNLPLRYDSPLAFVETAPGAIPHAWPTTHSSDGLTGGTPFVILRDSLTTHSRPQARPLKKVCEVASDVPRTKDPVQEKTPERAQPDGNTPKAQSIERKHKSTRISNVIAERNTATKRVRKL
ncbi:hypothetical protein BDY19DRAFT_996853 [Irpex rosettiformis]|uniref:Uncharacterized protein n=1 Tax=Irpex rosettiformis TaxID=378272 RepID=A0ACB8TTE8_9APHY|nr:hypothetical protein BDY19DRAFT_996853 [Irpex rosettiformis]